MLRDQTRRRRAYIGLNIYVSAVEDEEERKVDRNLLHGILSAFGFELTRGLLKGVFAAGGMHPVRCTEDIARAIRGATERRMPELETRLVFRRAA